MSKILASIACNLDDNILLAALPLFEDEKVEAMEWSFDVLFNHQHIPDWFTELLRAFSDEKRLIGHGVFFSLFTAKWSKEQDIWLKHLAKVSNNFHFDHITEHFGFMTGKDFHSGAPLGIPYTATTLAIGQDRLKRIQNACNCPVGLENLALSYSLEEVKKHGEFLDKLVDSVNGFIILDLHNLYCQIHNFKITFEEIILLYPLGKVREIHISGGSWETNSLEKDKQIRRDTHDDAVPEAVFLLLEKAILLCPNLKYVVLEQLGNGLETEEKRFAYQQDFLKMEEVVKNFNINHSQRAIYDFLPKEKSSLLLNPVEDLPLYEQQMLLSDILENANNYEEAKLHFQQSSLANSAWEIEKWDNAMLETALHIAQKWKNRA
jgi:uncharacterized protein